MVLGQLDTENNGKKELRPLPHTIQKINSKQITTHHIHGNSLFLHDAMK